MSTVKSQPISGVSAGVETVIMTRYPSISAGGLGRLLGSLYECIPVKVPVKLSHLLFVLPTAPLAALLYFGKFFFGQKYVLTNRSLQKWNFRGDRLISQVALTDIGQILIRQEPGQVFYKAADMQIQNTAGDTIMRLGAVPQADVFRQTILKTRAARLEVEESLATIQARG